MQPAVTMNLDIQWLNQWIISPSHMLRGWVLQDSDRRCVILNTVKMTLRFLSPKDEIWIIAHTCPYLGREMQLIEPTANLVNQPVSPYLVNQSGNC